MRTVLGAEQLREWDWLLRGKRIGFVTNFSGILPDFSRDTVDALMEEGYAVSRIFTPEHGLYGADAGERVENSTHPKYKIPVISLYGDRVRPTDEDIEGVDLFVYDIQDAGLRYYTYIYTMCYCLEKAADTGIPFLILDRPNPLGADHVWGAALEPGIHDFVGDYELPMEYGMTIGELAKYFLYYVNKKASLYVAAMKHYSREMSYPRTGLVWNTPSPALPTYESMVCYAGGCLFEAVNVSEGRGTGNPFQIYGAPFVDMEQFYGDVSREWDGDGIAFRKRVFTPSAGKHKGELCFGLECRPTKDACDFLSFSLVMLKCLFERYPDQVRFVRQPDEAGNLHLRTLYGNAQAEEYIRGRQMLSQTRESWMEEDREFREKTKAFYLY